MVPSRTIEKILPVRAAGVALTRLLELLACVGDSPARQMRFQLRGTSPRRLESHWILPVLQDRIKGQCFGFV